MKIFICILFCSALISCGQPEDDLAKAGGSCTFNNATPSNTSCIAFKETTTAQDAEADCDAIDDANATITGHTYSSSTTCSETSSLGTCLVANGTITYYSTDSTWNAGTAETNCGASPQSGTWTAAK